MFRLNNEKSKPVSEWNVDEICDWFKDMDLGMYADDLKKCLKIGKFQKISKFDIQKDITFKSSLHRKKIELALNEMTSTETDELLIKSGKLDTAWVSGSFTIGK